MAKFGWEKVVASPSFATTKRYLSLRKERSCFLITPIKDIGGVLYNCPEGFQVNLQEGTSPLQFFCVDEEEVGCPAGGILGAGCPDLDCIPVK